MMSVSIADNSTYSETFDSLASSGTGTGPLLPNGWQFTETGTSANTTYTAGTGSANTGDTYSFGAAGSTDRALGTLLSGSNTPVFGAQFTNDTGSALSALEIAFSGEQWRLGATGRPDRLDFQISFDATSLTSGTWTDVNALDFIAPVTSGTVGALNGNANAVALSATIDLIALTGGVGAGQTFWIRFADFNATSSDDGLAIDNFSMKATTAAVNVPGALSIDSPTIVEGNAGTADLVFTVNRTGGSNGAVSADWTVTLPGGVGGADGSDLAAGQALSGTVTFADGQTSASIIVKIAGDTAFEPTESFTVALSNPTGGATLGTSTGTGTITNDDAPPPAPVANVWINEFHYDNASTDSGEAIEIAGKAGTDLSGYTLVLYNGGAEGINANAATTYATINLSGVIDDEGSGYGALSFAAVGLQNGPFDGFALVAPNGQVIQFLSYEGSMTAANGPAAGLTSTDVGVIEGGSGALGNSLQLTGNGASGGDFTWQAETANSFGSLNGGQSIIADDATGLVSIRDASVREGDAGTTNLIFTVQRAGGLGSTASVSYSVALDGTANSADLAGAVGSGTVSFAVGQSSATISVAIAGDVVGEPNETLSVSISNPQGNISIVDEKATGTIVNDDPIALTISQIQGSDHQSQYVGQDVITNGIVTAVASNGFYLQSAAGDGDARTSDAVFVFTSTAPTVSVGDGLSVRGQVDEFQSSPVALSVTEIVAPVITVISTGNALPTAVLIGQGGLLPPTEVIEDDGFASFDPTTDGIDFWESMEGMRVTLDAPQAVSNTNTFGETDLVVSGGSGASGLNDRGGITISQGDYNPEKIQIDDLGTGQPDFALDYSIGDRLASVTGVLHYANNAFEVRVTEATTTTLDVTLAQETTNLAGDATHLSIATFNMENLDANDGKYALIANQIVLNLNTPDIIAAQEIQDADGAGSGSDLSGQATAQGLIDAILAAGGPRYVYVEVAPTTANSTGGEPNGNIRSGYFYNPDRVDYIAGSAALIENAAYAGSRRPLTADFAFNGEIFTAIVVHFTSRGGSEPLWGDHQPADNAGDSQRIAQAEGVKAYVNNELATDPDHQFVLLGDFNGFYFEESHQLLTDPAMGGVFTNLAEALLPAEERYSYMFEGNSQLLDNILVTNGLLVGAAIDAVHVNSEFVSNPNRPTDHDPQLALLYFNAAPLALELDSISVAENAPVGTAVGTLSGSDSAGDALTYSLVDDADGRFTVDPETGVITATASFDFEQASSFDIVARVTDQGGKNFDQGFTIAVTDVNEAPVAVADAVAIAEDATSANLWAQLLGNDSDPDFGATLSIVSVDTIGTLGTVVFDRASQTLRFIADADVYDSLAPGQSLATTFSYTAIDNGGLTSTATVTVTVTGIQDGIVAGGGNGADIVYGTGGEDTLSGLRGDDTLYGLGGHDWLDGGQGADRLYGGDGNDVLIGGQGDDLLYGGAGYDTFTIGSGSGRDTVFDFEAGIDRVVFADGLKLQSATVSDFDGDGRFDLTLRAEKGGSIVLFGIDDPADVLVGHDVSPDQIWFIQNGFAHQSLTANDLGIWP